MTFRRIDLLDALGICCVNPDNIRAQLMCGALEGALPDDLTHAEFAAACKRALQTRRHRVYVADIIEAHKELNYCSRKQLKQEAGEIFDYFYICACSDVTYCFDDKIIAYAFQMACKTDHPFVWLIKCPTMAAMQARKRFIRIYVAVHEAGCLPPGCDEDDFEIRGLIEGCWEPDEPVTVSDELFIKQLPYSNYVRRRGLMKADTPPEVTPEQADWLNQQIKAAGYD